MPDPLVVIAIIATVLLWLLFGIGMIVAGIRAFNTYQRGLFEIAMGSGAILLGVLTLVLPPLFIKYPAPDRPCVRYETTYQYNAATKTTMPVRYCAQYGEWVKP